MIPKQEEKNEWYFENKDCEKGKIKLKEDPSSPWNSGCQHPFLQLSTHQALFHCTLGNIQIVGWGTDLRTGHWKPLGRKKINFPSALLINVGLSFYTWHWRKYILVPNMVMKRRHILQYVPSALLCNCLNSLEHCGSDQGGSPNDSCHPLIELLLPG